MNRLLFVLMFLCFTIFTAKSAFADQAPIGYIDGVTSTGVVHGWAVDRDVPSTSIYVDIYIDGTYATGTYGQRVTTSVYRPDVNQVIGVSGNHGFNFQIPPIFMDGRFHTVYAYGIDVYGNVNTMLVHSGMFFNVGTYQTPVIHTYNCTDAWGEIYQLQVGSGGYAASTSDYLDPAATYTRSKVSLSTISYTDNLTHYWTLTLPYGALKGVAPFQVKWNSKSGIEYDNCK